VETSVGEGRELMTPGIPALRETVTEQDERASALLCDVQADAVGPHKAMAELGHRTAEDSPFEQRGARISLIVDLDDQIAIDDPRAGTRGRRIWGAKK
jgi:hypothetical protein